MAAMKDLMISIQEDIIDEILSFKRIAEKHRVSMDVVNLAWDLLCEQEAEEAARIDEELFCSDHE